LSGELIGRPERSIERLASRMQVPEHVESERFLNGGVHRRDRIRRRNAVAAIPSLDGDSRRVDLASRHRKKGQDREQPAVRTRGVRIESTRPHELLEGAAVLPRGRGQLGGEDVPVRVGRR
jgi:hypothetical protein